MEAWDNSKVKPYATLLALTSTLLFLIIVFLEWYPAIIPVAK